MKAWWRLRRAVAEVAPLLQPGDYRLAGDTARRLGEGAGGLLDPRRRRVAGPARASAVHDTVIRRSDCLILLAAERTHVTRLYRDPAKVERLVANSRWLRPAFPCPEAEPVDTGLAGWHGVREDFVSGRILRDAEPAQWAPTYRAFLHCCAANDRRCEGHLDPSAWFEELDGWTLPDPVGAAVARWRDGLAEVLDGAPLLRSHADAHNGNLMVTDGGELAAVWEAAGQTFRPQRRAAYLLAVAVAHAFRPQFADGPSERRRDKLVRSTEKFADDLLGEQPQ